MGILDIFSSDSGEQAAAQSRRATTKAVKKGFGAQKKFLQKGTKQQVNSLSQGLAPFEDLYGQGQQGREAYMDALGLGGEAGSLGARNMFTESPGYQYEQEMMRENAFRDNARYGGLRSGDTGMDLARYQQNLSNQEWGSWLDRLGGLGDSSLSAAQGQAGVLTNIGNAYGNQGTNLANAAGSKYDALGQANSQYAQNVYGAQQGANQNLWGAIGGLGGAALNVAGMGMPGAVSASGQAVGGGTIGGGLAKRLIG